MTVKSKIIYLLSSLLLISSDQISKLYLINYFENSFSGEIHILPIISLTHSWNHGISFGLFSNYSFSNILFFVFNSFIVLYLLITIYKSKRCPKNTALTLIISGAMGNIIDRIMHGAVFDFISIHYKNYYFPIFNLADAYITAGAAIYLLYILRKKSA